jgi:hypothetical protein
MVWLYLSSKINMLEEFQRYLGKTLVYRIGRLSSGSPPDVQRTAEAFRQGLRDLGYIEGQNLVIEYR